jgi:type IX secretion system PorP/SprF family membrane protein
MNYYNKIFLFISFGLFCSVSFAQQDPLNSMYVFDKMLVNPAFTGSSDWVVGTVKVRKQYTGLEGSPSTQTFNFHTPVLKRSMGLGLKVINDEIAVVKNLNAAAIFSYHLNFGGGKLSFGIEGGIQKREINYSKLILSQQNDNAFPLQSASATVPDVSWGLYYQKKQFYLGFSQYHLIKSTFNDGAESNSKLFNQLHFLVGNVFQLSDNWALELSSLTKYVAPAPIQTDVNAIIYYHDRIGVGFQYRTGDAIIAFLKINILENLRVAYGYDMVSSNLTPYAVGSHEILLSYGIKLPPPPSQKETHPRYYF